MQGMRPPPSVHVFLAPSRRVALGIGVATMTALTLLTGLPLAGWQHALLVTALFAWAWFAMRPYVNRRAGRAAVELWLAPNRLLAVRTGDGRLRAGHLRSASRVGAQVTTIVWRPDGAWWSRTILIVPDMLSAEEFRQLRVMLRYARSDAAQALPASQSTAV